MGGVTDVMLDADLLTVLMLCKAPLPIDLYVIRHEVQPFNERKYLFLMLKMLLIYAP